MAIQRISKGTYQGLPCLFLHRGENVETVRLAVAYSDRPTIEEEAIRDVAQYAFVMQELVEARTDCLLPGGSDHDRPR
jgi:hypothetical protein